MTRVMLGIFLVSVSVVAASQVEEFEFKNDFRPGYDKFLTIDQLVKLQNNDDIVVLDVRLQEDFASDPVLVPGANYKNPEELPVWISQIDKTKPVVVYCVAGKWVSQKVAYLLSESGISVQSLEGGIQAWKAHQE